MFRKIWPMLVTNWTLKPFDLISGFKSLQTLSMAYHTSCTPSTFSPSSPYGPNHVTCDVAFDYIHEDVEDGDK